MACTTNWLTAAFHTHLPPVCSLTAHLQLHRPGAASAPRPGSVASYFARVVARMEFFAAGTKGITDRLKRH
jgi:hypothetical protein